MTMCMPLGFLCNLDFLIFLDSQKRKKKNDFLIFLEYIFFIFRICLKRERVRERKGKGMMVRERLKKWLVIERADFRFVRFDLDLGGNRNKIKSREKNSL